MKWFAVADFLYARSYVYHYRGKRSRFITVLWFWDFPSSETQGQSVRTIQCSWWTFTVRSRWAPGLLLLPNQFQKRLNCLLLIGQKNFSEEKQPGDSRVSLHNVVFLIDRHSCVASSMGKVSQGKFQNRMLTTWKNYKLYHGCKKQTLSDESLGRIVRRYHKFL